MVDLKPRLLMGRNGFLGQIPLDPAKNAQPRFPGLGNMGFGEVRFPFPEFPVQLL